MGREKVYAAIDVGTTKVCTLVAKVNTQGEIELMGLGVQMSRGFKRGVVLNVNEISHVIRESIAEAERTAGTKITRAAVGITGSHIISMNNQASVRISRIRGMVKTSDILSAVESSAGTPLPPDSQVIHVIPRAYKLDGHKGVRDPVGMHGRRLDVETHIVLGDVNAIGNLVKAVRLAKVKADALVLEPLASAEAVLTQDEKELGVVLLDIGGGTADMAIFKDGTVTYTAVIPIAGYLFSNDLALALSLPFSSAEEAKLKFGNAMPHAVGENDMVELRAFGETGVKSVSHRELCKVLNERALELFALTRNAVEMGGFSSMPAAGLVLTGGTSNMAGLADLARDFFQAPVRVAGPKILPGMDSSMENPMYSTALGTLLWCIRHRWGAVAPHRRLFWRYPRLLAWLRERRAS